MAKKTGSTPSSTPSQTPPPAIQPKARQTLSSLRQDIETFLTKWNGNVFYNERDLQINLAIWLKRNCWNVDVEYFVPRQAFDISQPLLPDKYVWDNDMKLDIVVKVEEEFYIIELKYKTKIITSQIDRFGEFPVMDFQRQNSLNVQIVKNQGAQNFARYDFWKDVRRIELSQARFKNVNGGLAIFVTNDTSYLRAPNANAKCVKFSMEDNKSHSIDKHWNGTTVQNRPDFDVNSIYTTDWKHMGTAGTNGKMSPCLVNGCKGYNSATGTINDFFYCIVEIP